MNPISFMFILSLLATSIFEVSLCGILGNVLDFDIIENKFQLQSPYYIYFWTNTVRKGMNLLTLNSYRLNSTPTTLLPGWLWH